MCIQICFRLINQTQVFRLPIPMRRVVPACVSQIHIYHHTACPSTSVTLTEKFILNLILDSVYSVRKEFCL